MRGSVPSADRYQMPYLIRNHKPTSFKLTGEDNDHSFCPKSAKELEDDAGQALLKSRVQRVWRQWNSNKNEAFLRGMIQKLELPKTRNDKFGLTILSCAGYMAPQVLDLSDPKSPNLVTLSRKDYDRMRKLGRPFIETAWDFDKRSHTQTEAKQCIGKFFASYFAEQDLSHLDDQVDEFLHTKNPRRVAELSRVIITDAIELAVDPIRPLYAEALDSGMLALGAPDPAEVIELVFPSNRWIEHHEVMRDRLAYAA